ncbi:MAG: septum formation initiator family protein [Actinomycetota bacterium]
MSARATALHARSAPRKAELRVVRRKSRRLIKRTAATRIAPIAIIAAIGVAAIIAMVLLMQVVLAQSAFHVSDLRQEIQQEQARHEELVLEAARLDSAGRIERYARESLGMIAPDPAAIHYIVADVGRRGGIQRVPTVAASNDPGVAAGSPFTLSTEETTP